MIMNNNINQNNVSSTRIVASHEKACVEWSNLSDEQFCEEVVSFKNDPRRLNKFTNQFKYVAVYPPGKYVTVNKNTFSSIMGFHVVNYDLKIKFVFVGKFDKRKLTNLVNNYAESQLDVTFGLYSYIKKAVNAFDNFVSIGNSSPVTFLAHSKTQDLSKLPYVVYKVIKLLEDFSWERVIDIVYLLYDLLFNFTQPQLDFNILPFIVASLPKNISSFISDCQRFSNMKIFDNVGVLSDIFSTFKSLIDSLILIVNDKFRIDISWILEYFTYFDNFIYIKEMSSLLEKSKQNHFLLDASNRKLVTSLYSRCVDSAVFVDLVNRSISSKKIFESFSILFKKIHVFETVSREEPSCFVFEGPPGCLKSVTMSRLVSGINKSVYVHSVKPNNDTKDFYDSYNNEQVFCMDDVGQQGISQWRTIINMVSPIRCPLDCANVDLKDTKVFSSEVMLITTNNLRNLGFPLRDDGISDINALYRRCNVFNFSCAKNLDGELNGVVKFEYFDLDRKSYVNDFPKEIKDTFKLYKMNVLPSFSCNSENRIQFLKWIKSIIDCYRKIKSLNKKQNTLSPEEILSLSIDEFEDTLPQLELKEFFNSVQDRIDSLDYKQLFSKGCVFGFLGLSFCAVSYALYKYFSNSSSVSNVDCNIKQDYENTSTAVSTISSAIKEADFYVDNMLVKGVCLISGHLIMTVAHGFKEDSKVVVVVYDDRSKNQRLLDMCDVSVFYYNSERDVCVLSLPRTFPTPFKNLSKFFKRNNTSNNLLLLTPNKIVDLSLHFIPRVGSVVYNTKNNATIRFELEKEGKCYDFGGAGLCGSLAVTKDGYIKGMHVAGVGVTLGYTMFFSDKMLDNLYDIFKADNKFALKVDIKQSKKLDFSGIKLDANFHSSTPKNTSFVKSPLYDVFPITRIPVKLSVNGPHTIKDVEMKYCQPVVYVSQDEISFVERMLDDEFKCSFNILDEHTIVSGNQYLAGLNKKSSNGLFCEEDKCFYIDFVNGKYTDVFREELIKFENEVKEGNINFDHVSWKCTLKDEIRNIEKADKPRGFKVSRLHVQVLTKKYFGDFVQNIIKNRQFNQIMVGCNPFADWKKIYESLSSCDGIWAGDIGSYDSKMLPQFQSVLNKKVLEWCKDANLVAEFLLQTLLIRCNIVNDDVYISTHSMPSGTFLTAIFNSIINRMYTYLWFYRYFKGEKNISNFKKYVIDYVYGDDKLNGVHLIDDNSRYLTALTMKDVFHSLGMDFTNSKKKEIYSEYEDIDDVTFLKRSFRFHPLIGDIVAPLDTNTIYSSLSWIDSKKDTQVVLRDKINSFQREIFLHFDCYDKDVNLLKSYCESNCLPFVLIPVDYLINLYRTDVDAYIDKPYLYC